MLSIYVCFDVDHALVGSCAISFCACVETSGSSAAISVGYGYKTAIRAAIGARPAKYPKVRALILFAVSWVLGCHSS